MAHIIQVKKVKYFWVYFIVGAIAIIASVFLAPIWDGWKECPWKTWGTEILGVVVAVAIAVYLGWHVLRKIIHSRGIIQVLYIIEFVLLALIALGSVLAQFKVLPISEICKIIGLIVWCEGGIDLFRAYFHQRDSKSRYPIWRLCLAIALVTLGTYMFAAPFFTNRVVLWIFVSFLLLVGILGIGYGIAAKPASKPKAKKVKSTSTKDKKTATKEDKPATKEEK